MGGCCGSREDWCSGHERQPKSDMIEVRYNQKNYYSSDGNNDVPRPQRYTHKNTNGSRDYGDFTPQSKGREQGNSDDGDRFDFQSADNIHNKSIISSEVINGMNNIKKGRFIAKDYKGYIRDIDSNTFVDVNVHLVIDLIKGTIVGYVKNQGIIDVFGKCSTDSHQFKLKWKGVKKEDIVTGRFTKADYSQLTGNIKTGSFGLDDDEEDDDYDKEISLSAE